MNLSITSFFVNFLLVLWVLNKNIAQYFYPYVYVTGVLGIAYALLLMCSSEVQKFHSYFFAKSTINDFQDEWKTWFLVYVISYKALLMYIYPYNMNKTAML